MKSAFPKSIKASSAVPGAFAGLVGDQPLELGLLTLTAKGEAIVSVEGLPNRPVIAKITTKKIFAWCVKALEGPTSIGGQCIYSLGTSNGQICLVAQRLTDVSKFLAVSMRDVLIRETRFNS